MAFIATLNLVSLLILSSERAVAFTALPRLGPPSFQDVRHIHDASLTTLCARHREAKPIPAACSSTQHGDHSWTRTSFHRQIVRRPGLPYASRRSVRNGGFSVQLAGVNSRLTAIMNMSVEEDSCSHQPQNGVSQGRGGMEQEGGDKGVVKGSGQSREMFLRAGATALGIFAAGLGLGPPVRAARAVDLGGIDLFGTGESDHFKIPPEDNPDGLKSPRPLAYRIEYTDPPTTVPFPKDLENNLVTEMSQNQLIFVGTHEDSAVDQQLAAGLMGRIATKLKGNVGIGLEQVERQFQGALDAYVAGGKEAGAAEPGPTRDAADQELAKATQWEERSSLPFDAYRPVFHLARRRGLPLVALGVDSEQAFQVLTNGMDALGESARNEYVTDFKGFVTYVRDKGFQTYADKLIFPSYEELKTKGMLGDKPPTKPNFFSARILADEGVASKAVEWVSEHNATPMLVLQKEDHVKYGFGASGRASRIAESFGGIISTKTALLNPTAADSLSGTRALRLALEYAEDLYGGKPLANYIWFTKSPRVNQIPRMLNPENKGWLESVNLYDFREAAAT